MQTGILNSDAFSVLSRRDPIALQREGENGPSGRGDGAGMGEQTRCQDGEGFPTDGGIGRAAPDPDRSRGVPKALDGVLPEERWGDGAMGKTPIPHDFELTAEMKDWAERVTPRVNVEIEFEKFCDYWRANGKIMADWNATLRNWLRRCIEFKGAALYTADEMTLKRLMQEYEAQGFRRAYRHENSAMYRVAYEAFRLKRDGVPIRDMGVVTQLAAAKRA